jgi:hypothetical protein
MPGSARSLLVSAFVLGFAVSTACSEDDDCPTGSNGCPCGDGGVCRGDLICSDGTCVEPGTGEDGGDGAGDSCENEGATACVDDETLATCQDGVIEVMSCSDLCEAAGYGASEGCATGEDGIDACFCLPADGGSCDEPGAGVCANEDELLLCGDDNTWSLIDCDQSCSDSGYDSSFGCQYSEADGQDRCICGEYCEEEGAKRCDGDYVEICEGGVWQYGDCAAECTGGSLGDFGHGTCVDAGTDTGCICYDEAGGPCEIENDQACLGSDSVGLCLGGSWWYMECPNACDAIDCTGTTGCNSSNDPPICECTGCP